IPTASQDLILSTFCSFSYINQPLQALQEMRRALRSGGRIFLLTASLRYPQRKSYIVNQHRLSVAMTLMKADELKQFTSRAGFTQITLHGFQCLGDHLSFLSSQIILTRLLKAEMLTLGRWFPDV